ncbi:hypothetical protein MKQ70_02745 [Chitinophaga sedimenti]|uniref:hypothetical protein n=1 Tax=Chitinophaga sedimenti TaxID=2033606 RepID=UPI002004F6DC|nr:hypothetical protein [Chitinophaga sedimenti]MCK7553982.1 hypothetical protein [Chitinophaga sedimenti]
MPTVKVTSIIDASRCYEYVDNGVPKQGGVKDVYFSPDRKYVVAFFRTPLDFNQKDRIRRIVTLYLDNIKKGMPLITSCRTFTGGHMMPWSAMGKQG